MRARGTVAALILLAGCAATPPAPVPGATEPPSTPPASTPAAPASTVREATPVPEPTTTNTLPPPPEPTTPAPTRAGALTAASLPIPAGWRTYASKGGQEEGYRGNGTWVHGRDPRYAAYESITMGCAPVTRDDYPDPELALEGIYRRGDEPGVSLTMQFGDADRATAYLAAYRRQVSQCRDPDVLQAVVSDTSSGLSDRRTYPDGDWTEVVEQRGNRVTIVLLSDPGHRMTPGQITDLRSRIAAAAQR